MGEQKKKVTRPSLSGFPDTKVTRPGFPDPVEHDFQKVAREKIEANVASEEWWKADSLKTYNDLRDAGYKGNYVKTNDWGRHDSMGGIGAEKAREIYDQNLAYGKETGDWSYMDNFMEAAQYGNRKYHRAGLFGTGFDPMPHNLLDATLLVGGAAAGAGLFPGAGAGTAITGTQSTVALNAAGAGAGGFLSSAGSILSSGKKLLEAKDALSSLLSPGNRTTSGATKAIPREKEVLDVTDEDVAAPIPVQDTSRLKRLQTSSKRYANRGRSSVLSV